MTAVDETRQLRDQARSLRSQALDIRAHARAAVAAAAATEDQIAATFDQLAREQPGRAGQLRDIGASARAHAARKRGRLVCQPGGGTGPGRDHAPAASGPDPGLPAAAAPVMPDQAGDLSVIEVRDRIAARLRDTIIRRVFAAGLSLHSAAGLTANPEVCSRIEAAASELDQVIPEVRNAIFGAAQQPDGCGPGPDLADLGGQLATTASIRISGQPGRARLLLTLRVILGLIGEHATPASVDITAGPSSCSLAIEAAPLTPGEPAGERAPRLPALQAKAAQIGVGVAAQPVPGGTRFLCELPAGS